MTRDEILQIARADRHAWITTDESATARLRAAIKQHVAEAVRAEQEELFDLVDRYAKNNADLKAAIRARAEK